MKSISQTLATSVVFLLVSNGSTQAATPITKTKSGATISDEKGNMLSTSGAGGSYNKTALHRLDFKIVGKSCAACLLGIQKRMGGVPGVIKSAVQLKPPYAAAVIYDSSKTMTSKIMEKAKETLPDLQTEQEQDAKVGAVPMFLIPKIGENPGSAETH
jgi:copper chaperone CopZ